MYTDILDTLNRQKLLECSNCKNLVSVLADKCPQCKNAIEYILQDIENAILREGTEVKCSECGCTAVIPNSSIVERFYKYYEAWKENRSLGRKLKRLRFNESRAEDHIKYIKWWQFRRKHEELQELIEIQHKISLLKKNIESMPDLESVKRSTMHIVCFDCGAPVSIPERIHSSRFGGIFLHWHRR